MKRKKMPLPLIICDVYYFKLYNDSYEHQTGDDCLKNIAQTLNKVVHNPEYLVARYGGEEFIIILPNTDTQAASIIAEIIRLEVEKYQNYSCSISN